MFAITLTKVIPASLFSGCVKIFNYRVGSAIIRAQQNNPHG